MINLDVFISNIITGFSVGLGSALSTYLINQHFIRKWETLDKKFEERYKRHA